mgnify:CR=1 FL=1
MKPWPFLRWLLLVGAVLTALSACNPALNWRLVRFDDQADKLLLPCKPDQAERQVQQSHRQQAELEHWQPKALMQSRGPGFKTLRSQRLQ